MDDQYNTPISWGSITRGSKGQMGEDGSVESIIRKWPVTMLVIALQYIEVFSHLDFSSLHDLYLFIGQEDDYILWDI